MRTELPKVAHTVLGKPLVLWAADAMIQSGIENLVIVISPAQKVVEDIISSAQFPQGCAVRVAYQENAQGTGHAVTCAMSTVEKLIQEKNINPQNADVIVGIGDTPAFPSHAFAAYHKHHIEEGNACTVLAFNTENPHGYGRVITKNEHEFVEIREHKDCSPEQQKVTLCNSGLLCCDLTSLKQALPKVQPSKASGEYYLTEVPHLIKSSGKKVSVFSGISPADVEGVNSQAQLAAIAASIQGNIITQWMEKGVQFLMPHCTYVEPTVTFDSGVIVEPFCFLAGNSHFKANSRIVAGSKYRDGKLVP